MKADILIKINSDPKLKESLLIIILIGINI